MVLRNLINHWEYRETGRKFDDYHILYEKFNKKCIQKLDIRHEGTKCMKENVWNT